MREVEEETGVVARPHGICGLRSRYDDRKNDTYVIFLLEHLSGKPRSDGHENDEVRYFSRGDLDSSDVTDLSAYFGKLALAGSLTLMPLAEDFGAAAMGRNPDHWKLFG